MIFVGAIEARRLGNGVVIALPMKFEVGRQQVFPL